MEVLLNSMTYNLERFEKAHAPDYQRALAEIRAGQKTSHWIWYIFPQLKGLGFSYHAEYYGIADENEAQQYLAHPVLGARLREITTALLELPKNNPLSVMGHPDDLKLLSSMTLFAQISDEGSIFHQVIDKYYGGNPDKRTLQMLGKL